MTWALGQLNELFCDSPLPLVMKKLGPRIAHLNAKADKRLKERRIVVNTFFKISKGVKFL